MSRRDDERLADVLASAEAIRRHLERGGLDDGLVFDAVRVRLIEIGEAVKDIDPDLLASRARHPVAGRRRDAGPPPTGTSTPPTRSSRPPSTRTSRRSWLRPSDCWLN